MKIFLICFSNIQIFLKIKRVHFHYYKILLFYPWHWIVLKHHRQPDHLSNSFYDNISSIKICYHDRPTSTNLPSITLKICLLCFIKLFANGSNLYIIQQTTYSNLQQALAQRHQKAQLLFLYPLPV